MNALFITGSDTGCGKTTVGTALARSARGRGMRVAVLKPVETGCETQGGSLLPADARALAEAANDKRSLEQICPYRFALPAAPWVAARAAGVAIEFGVIAAAYREAAAHADLVLVEGAGGVRVPLSRDLDMAGLARRLGLPVLLVVRARLGTFNHTQLSLEALEAQGLVRLGVVISHAERNLPPAEQANLDLLRERLAVPLLAELAFDDREIDLGTLLDKLAER